MAQDPLHLLCIEPRFPGRLGGTADWLVRHRGYHCWFYCASTDAPEHWPASAGKGLEVVGYQAGGAAREPAVTWMRYLERGLCHAYGSWETLESRRPRPVELVLGRSAGLGSTLFAPVYLPGVPIVNYFDYFYHAHAHDLAAEAGPDMPVEYFHWRRSANAMDLLDLESGATAWTATRWQRDLYPAEYHDDFLVLHDGVSTARLTPQRRTTRRVAGRTLSSDTLVVSFVARNLDRVRGFDRFLELANRLLRRYPSLVCIVLGGPLVQRGLDFQFFNQDYAARALQDAPPHDPQRFWMLGSVPPATVAEVLTASDLHVYPSRSFPVSRSMMEALASGCIVLASDTEPVREMVTDGQTGLLAAGSDAESWERQACAVLDDLAGHWPLAEAATRMVRDDYSQDVTLPRLAAYFNDLAERAALVRELKKQGHRCTMHVLFIHQAFPAQFGRLGLELHKRYGWKCSYLIEDLSSCPTPTVEMLQRLEIHRLSLSSDFRKERLTPWPQAYGRHLQLAQAVFEAVRARPNLRPDLVVGHDGLGPTLFLPELLSCPIVNYCEFYFAPRQCDISYRIDLPPAEPAEFYPRSINAATLVDLAAFSWGYAPTHWQRQTFPEHFRHKIEVHFDGLDTELYKPRQLPRTFAGRTIPADHRLVTYVARGLESMRGFDLFMRLAQRIARERSDVLFAVVGQDRSYYGWDRLHTGQSSFKQWVLSQGDYDLSRFLFVEHLQPDQLADLLCMSDLHVYLTVPFVLSWSLFNALASGCVVLGSDVPPVREVISAGVNGLIEPLFDTDRQLDTALRVLADPAAYRPMGQAGRQVIEEKYSLEVAVPELKDFFERVARSA